MEGMYDDYYERESRLARYERDNDEAARYTPPTLEEIEAEAKRRAEAAAKKGGENV